MMPDLNAEALGRFNPIESFENNTTPPAGIVTMESTRTCR